MNSVITPASGTIAGTSLGDLLFIIAFSMLLSFMLCVLNLASVLLFVTLLPLLTMVWITCLVLSPLLLLPG